MADESSAHDLIVVEPRRSGLNLSSAFRLAFRAEPDRSDPQPSRGARRARRRFLALQNSEEVPRSSERRYRLSGMRRFSRHVREPPPIDRSRWMHRSHRRRLAGRSECFFGGARSACAQGSQSRFQEGLGALGATICEAECPIKTIRRWDRSTGKHDRTRLERYGDIDRSTSWHARGPHARCRHRTTLLDRQHLGTARLDGGPAGQQRRRGVVEPAALLQADNDD